MLFGLLLFLGKDHSSGSQEQDRQLGRVGSSVRHLCPPPTLTPLRLTSDDFFSFLSCRRDHLSLVRLSFSSFFSRVERSPSPTETDLSFCFLSLSSQQDLVEIRDYATMNVLLYEIRWLGRKTFRLRVSGNEEQTGRVEFG